MFTRFAGYVFAMLLLLAFGGTAGAGTFGTIDGTYDFGNLNTTDHSGGSGYEKLGDKFKVGNGLMDEWLGITSGTMTAIYGSGMYLGVDPANTPDNTAYTVVLKAEGGSTAKTFTFKDMGITFSPVGSYTRFTSFNMVFKDYFGNQIGATVSLGPSGDISYTAVTNLSTLYAQSPWSIPGVASIEISYISKYCMGCSGPSDMAFNQANNLTLENITIANVSNVVPPTVTAISPTSGPDVGGTSVTITGTTLTGATAVTIGGAAATGVTVVNATTITATTPPGTAGAQNVVVTTPGGTGTASGLFTYIAVTAPTVTTQAVSTIAATTATGNGNITATNGATATARGVVHYPYTNTDLVIGGVGVTNVAESGSFGTGAFTAALTGLAVNTQYNARAHASSIYGTGYGARAAFWTLANVPSAPTVNNPTGTTLDVAVNANGNPAGTEFCMQETSTGNYVQASGALGAACVWQAATTWGTKTVTGLNSGTTYTFQIKARNGGLTETAYGATASGIPVVAPTTYGLTYDGNGQTSGSAPSDATAYASGASATVLGNTGSLVKTGNTFVGWNLASNGGGTHYAVGSSYTIISNTTLYAQWLGIVSATAASSVTPSGFTANWGSVAGATGYRLDVATDSGFTGFVSGYNNLDVGNVTSWAVGGLAPGTSYFYRLRTYSASLTAANSNSISLTTQTGRVSGIVVDPGAPATLYAAVDGGGVFTSSNSGASWSATAGQPGSNRVQKLLLVAGSPTTLYAATYGSGIFFSINSGTSWSACTGQPANLNVLALTGDASGRLYAGTEGGIFTSTNSCTSWSPVNGGLTVDATKPALAIVIDPNSASTLYAGFDGSGIWGTTNGGANWTAAATQPANTRVKELAIQPGDGSKLYAATYGGGAFKSSDSGVNWSTCATQPGNLNLLSLVMDAAGKLYAGSEAGVFVSSDACATWTALNSGLPN